MKFTTEGEESNGLTFLDTNTIRREDGSLKVTIYRKPTHTDQYLHFSSNHLLQHKLGVVQTLHHRAKSVITEEEDCERELSHVKSALGHCGYPDWAIQQATKVTEKSK